MFVNILSYLSLYRSQLGDKIIVKKSLEKEVMIHSGSSKSQLQKIYLMTSGIALVQVQSKLGRKYFYSLVLKEQLFGIEALLDESQRPKEIAYTVVAQTDVEYLEIDRQFFLDHLYTDPVLSKFFLKNMISQFMFLAQSHQLMNESVTVRVANTLIELISKLSLLPTQKGTITFPKVINQKFIANYTNVSISRTSSVFKYLEENKMIKRGPIQIIDLEKLKSVRFKS